MNRIINFTILAVMVITSVIGCDVNVVGAVHAESSDNITSQPALTETTEDALDNVNLQEDETATQGNSNIQSEKSPKKNTVVSQNEEGIETTTPEPIRNTELITNPYKGYSYSRLIKEISKLQAQYPDIIQTEYIGKTVGGRKIPLVKLGNGNRKILIMGTEHAREYVTTSLIMRSIDTYSQAYVRDKKISGTNVKNVLDKVTFYFVPMVNIDGAQIVMGTATAKDKKKAMSYVGKRYFNRYKDQWKSNLRGVDLNRNYPFRWSLGLYTKKRGYMECKGPKQASEPEVKSIVKLCENNDFAFMLTMHTKGQVIYWKDKYNDVVPGANALANKVKSITNYKKMPTSQWRTCAGESAKWFRSVYNKPALTVELTPMSMSYKKAPKNFDKCVWSKNKALFLKTALVTTPTDKYKVFFNAGKGKVAKRYINIKTDKSYGSLPTPKRRGYKFLGWYTKQSGGTKVTSTSVFTKTKNSTLYAKWKKK